jgi:hypothetical protein
MKSSIIFYAVPGKHFHAALVTFSLDPTLNIRSVRTVLENNIKVLKRTQGNIRVEDSIMSGSLPNAFIC